MTSIADNAWLQYYHLSDIITYDNNTIVSIRKTIMMNIKVARTIKTTYFRTKREREKKKIKEIS